MSTRGLHVESVSKLASNVHFTITSVFLIAFTQHLKVLLDIMHYSTL